MSVGRLRILLVDDDEVEDLLTSSIIDEIYRGQYELDWVSSYEPAPCAAHSQIWRARKPGSSAASMRSSSRRRSMRQRVWRTLHGIHASRAMG